MRGRCSPSVRRATSSTTASRVLHIASKAQQAEAAFLRWRKTLPALQWGSIEFHDAPEPVLAFTRHHADQSLLVAFNLSANAVQWEIPEGLQVEVMHEHGLLSGEMRDGTLHLPAHAVFFARLA